MIYLDYERYKHKYLQTQIVYDELISERVSILAKGQSDSDRLREIDELIKRLQQSLEDREKLLKLKEKELRESNNPDDIVYRLRFMEHMKVKKISRIVHYSDTQVYRMLQSIQSTINETLGLSQHGRE